MTFYRICTKLTNDQSSTAHIKQYRESFDVYGSKKTFEWTLVEHEDSVIHTGEKAERVKIPDYAHLLPQSIQSFTTGGVYDAESNKHLSFIQGAGHGGSHPHLVHEFITALVKEREPFPNARQSANITCVGILAHESAIQEGKQMFLPDFTLNLP